jgi:hypothetical protein
LKFINVNNSDGQVAIDDIAWTGYTPSSPVIVVTGALDPFSTTTGTPSAAQSYTLSGVNLTTGISITAPEGFHISTDGGATYASSGSVASSFNGLIHVRMTGVAAGTFGGDIVHTSTSATAVNLAASGTVSDPVPTIHTTGTLAAFTTEVGTPSAAQSYTLYGEYLTGQIVITAPAGFHVSSDNVTFDNSASVGPTYNGLIYVRLTGTTIGDYSGNITHNSTGAAQVDLAVSGSVTSPVAATLFLEENFAYTVGTTVVSNGWSAHSAPGTASPLVDATNLSYTSYIPNSGGSARTTGVTGEDISKGFTEQTSGDVYCSFLFHMTGVPSMTQDYCFHLGDAAVPGGGTTFRGRLYVQKNATDNIRFGVSKGSANTTVISWTGGSYASGTYDYALNTTYLIVMKYSIVPGTVNDEVSLWINPAISPVEPAAQLFIGTADTTSDPSNIGSIAIRQSLNTPAAYYDGFRVSNDWATLWSGELNSEILVNTDDLVPLANIAGSPSEEVTFYNLSGNDLTGPINLVAPTHFEISLSETEGWQGTLQVASSFDGPIYVRLNSSVVGEHSGDITHNSAGADEVLVRVDGETFPPSVTWNITESLVPFSTEAGTPSDPQSYLLSATNATGNLIVTSLEPFELSSTGTGGWGYALDLPNNFNGNVYVRFNPTTAGDYNGTILHVTADATNYELAVSGTATPPAGNYATDLFFSEYLEGSSNNKAIEIYNGTGLPVDLSAYTVKLGSNGNPWGNTITLTGTLAHDDVYVIANPSANATILGLADVTSTVTYFNGDDALGLFHGDTQIDAIGVYQTDPGTAWDVAGVTNATLDHTLIRKPTVIEGNLDWAASAGTNADNSEWVVQGIDYITDLGLHTFTPGAQMTATPTFDPAPVIYYAPINVTISSTTPGATIRYTTDGSDPSETYGTVYTAPIPVSATTTFKAIAYATGFIPSGIATATYTFPIQVSTIAQLRAQPTGVNIYQLTGEAVLTFQQTTRHQKYIQDSTAAIVIDDPSAVITTTYNLYDGITGVTGLLGLYNELLQFTPIADPGPATSNGNVVVPEVRTLASLTSADQAKLIKVMDVTIDATNVNFGTAAENINITDPTATLVMRTFPGTDYSGTPIPVDPVNLTCLVGQYQTTMQVSPRFLADFEAAGGTLSTPVVTISADALGNLSIQWDAVPGAFAYRIEHSDDPYTGYTQLDVTTGTSYPLLTEPRKFYRVIAIDAP